MSLVDTIHCEYPLPEPADQALTFQTKDFECLLDTYLITAEGRLIRKTPSASIQHDGPRSEVERGARSPSPARL